MPKYGWFPVTVPGAPAAWAELSARFGKLPLTEVMAPAIAYAEQGFPLSPTVGRNWENAFNRYSLELKDEHYKSWFSTFAPQGRAPKIGELWCSPDHARTLQSIAETKARSLTTVIGLVPLALSGSDLFEPLSIAIMCGLTASTLLTQVIIPVVYSLWFTDEKLSTKTNNLTI